MYTIDALLLVVKEAGEKGLQGRTLLQKKVYFLSELMGINLEFSAHYYGPYSSLVAGNLASLVSHGFLEEVTEVFEERHRHTYFLTDAAEELWSDIENDPEFSDWKEKLDLINARKIANDHKRLSIAAKVHYIVKWRRKSTIGEVKQVAKEYGWDVNQEDIEDIEDVLDFLTYLGLVKPDESCSF